MPTTAFTRDPLYWSGSWGVSPGGRSTVIQAIAIDSTVEFVATGTACSINLYLTGAGVAEISVDGSAWADIVTTYADYVAYRPFSGLADSAHSVRIRAKARASLYVTQADANFNPNDPVMSVTGASPACTAPSGVSTATNYLVGAASDDALGQVGALNKVRLESGFAGGYDSSAAGLNPSAKSFGPSLGSDGSNTNANLGAQVRFKATTTRVDVWIKNDGQAYGLVVDGAYPVARRVVTPNTGRWGWVTLRPDLDGTTEHTYGVVLSFEVPSDISAGSGEVWAVRTPGGTFNAASRPALRPTIVFCGDSITAGQDALRAAVDGLWDESDALQGWVYRTADRLGYQVYNAGIGSTTLHDFTGGSGSLSGQGLQEGTTWSGERRASHDVVAPAPDKVVVMYGRNDVGDALFPGGAPTDTLSMFSTSFANMVNTINAGLPTIDVYIMGILPASAGVYNNGRAESDRIAFNAAMVSDLASIADAKNHYISPDRWGYAGSPGDQTGTDFSLTTLDGLHPGRNGRDLVYNGLYNAMTGTPTIGVVPVTIYPLQTKTLRLSGFGTAWLTSHNLTASAGTLGSPSVGQDGWLTVPYTAPSTAQNVTITDTGSGATGTLFVVVPALTLSQTSANPGDVVSLGITAPFTDWDLFTASTLFTADHSISLTGSTVAGIGIATLATFTVPNSPGGSVVITDTSTGQTATLTVSGSAATNHGNARSFPRGILRGLTRGVS